MKTLLIFFIPLIMMGQDLPTIVPRADINTGFHVDDEIEFILNGETSNLFSDYINQTILKSLEEYEAECYADSTKSFKVIGILSSESNPYPTYQYDTVWVHRESGIPKGFIEFLRKTTTK